MPPAPKLSMKLRAADSRHHWLAGTTIRLPREGHQERMHRRPPGRESILVNSYEASSVAGLAAAATTAMHAATACDLSAGMKKPPQRG
jgi:hypothetical protein